MLVSTRGVGHSVTPPSAGPAASAGNPTRPRIAGQGDGLRTSAQLGGSDAAGAGIRASVTCRRVGDCDGTSVGGRYTRIILIGHIAGIDRIGLEGLLPRADCWWSAYAAFRPPRKSLTRVTRHCGRRCRRLPVVASAAGRLLMIIGLYHYTEVRVLSDTCAMAGTTGGPAAVECGTTDGFVHPDFPQTGLGKARPAGRRTHPYDLHARLLKGCHPITGT
jgi:hypothetical protein